jgi:hypothetical protein
MPLTVIGPLNYIVPTINAAAEEAGKPTPRVVCVLPVCVTDDPDVARARAAKVFEIYGQLPSYRAMLDREGAEGPADVAIVGNEDQVASQIMALADCGVTDFAAGEFARGDERERTRAAVRNRACVHRGRHRARRSGGHQRLHADAVRMADGLPSRVAGDRRRDARTCGTATLARARPDAPRQTAHRATISALPQRYQLAARTAAAGSGSPDSVDFARRNRSITADHRQEACLRELPLIA